MVTRANVSTGTSDSAYSISGTRTGCPVIAPISRATPRIERQSPRFGVSSSSRNVSPITSSSGAPTTASSESTIIPSCSSLISNSASEQIMPSDTTPRIVAGLSSSRRPVCMFSSITPGRAKQIFWPAATFGAPHTTSSGGPSPGSTSHNVRLSALGCGLVARTYPTTQPSQPPRVNTSPASMPPMVSRCANSSGPSVMSTYCESQENGMIMILSGGFCRLKVSGQVWLGGRRC